MKNIPHSVLEWYNEMIGPFEANKLMNAKSDVNTSYDYEAARQTVANSSDIKASTVH